MGDLDHARADGFLAFELKPGSGTIQSRDVPTIVRAAGLQLNQDQMTNLVNQMKQAAGFHADDEDASVSRGAFDTVLDKWLAEHPKKAKSANFVEVLSALKTLDKDGCGWFAPSDLAALFAEHGDTFSRQEVDTMLSAAVDKQSNKVYIEDFAALLSKTLR